MKQVIPRITNHTNYMEIPLFMKVFNSYFYNESYVLNSDVHSDIITFLAPLPALWRSVLVIEGESV